jgi:hypothetical protein
MASILEQDFQKALNPNGKAVGRKMPPLVQQMMRVFFYCGWSAGASRIMQAGRMLDETSQMLAIMEIMDCIEKDYLFLGKPKEELISSPEFDSNLPEIN